MGSPEVKKSFYNMFAMNYFIGFNQIATNIIK